MVKVPFNWYRRLSKRLGSRVWKILLIIGYCLYLVRKPDVVTHSTCVAHTHHVMMKTRVGEMWCLRGVCVVFVWCLCGVSVVFLWCFCGVSVVFLWCL